jgi:predicted ester cyclase
MGNKQIVSEFFIKGYNENDYAAVRKLLLDEYYDHSPAYARSSADAINILKIVHDIFPDMEVEIIDLIEENNKVVGRFKFKATHSSEYMGVKPTNKRLEWEAIEIFRIENDKIVESWGYWPDSEIKDKLIKLSQE